MSHKPATPDAYVAALPDERKAIIQAMRETVLKNIPKGFEETISYGMIGYVVPHSLYPAGYHCDPKLPLPFISIASQKSHIGFYHMGIYAHQELLNWFTAEWPKYSKKKLDMGKSCIRFKKAEDVPLDLLAALVKKMKPKDWITCYESQIKR
ncbi:MAG: DUF1801 domain-containing protein [Bacteroidia bacterium]|jgi:uncharacterized protein YdhG (YjbR/CyaY superfamily)|nr:DUF1801 domain-containing protein [Bacteroidia bacterium]